MLPTDGPAVIDYADIAKRARCDRRTAIRAIAFGVAVGCIERETGKLNRSLGDCWNETNIYRWIGPPREPIQRGQFAAFLRARGGSDISGENVTRSLSENVTPSVRAKHSMTDEEPDGRPGGTKGDGLP